MPFGADRIANIASYDALPTLAAAICQAPNNFHKVTTIPNKGSVKNSWQLVGASVSGKGRSALVRSLGVR